MRMRNPKSWVEWYRIVWRGIQYCFVYPGLTWAEARIFAFEDLLSERKGTKEEKS